MVRIQDIVTVEHESCGDFGKVVGALLVETIVGASGTVGGFGS
jgi:hypothetical protein